MRYFSFCNNCGKKLKLPNPENLNAVSNVEERKLDQQEKIALRRTSFETALVKIQSYVRTINKNNPKCFISYAWGVAQHEQWVLRLAKDLKKAGINILFDRWDNLPGTSITRFVDQILDSEFVIVIGTSSLLQKYKNTTNDPVVSAEQKLINTRIRQPSKYGYMNVIPLLLEGDPITSFTPFLQDIVYINCLDESFYFYNLFTIIRQIFEISIDNAFFQELQNSVNPNSVNVISYE